MVEAKLARAKAAAAKEAADMRSEIEHLRTLLAEAKAEAWAKPEAATDEAEAETRADACEAAPVGGVEEAVVATSGERGAPTGYEWGQTF